jgi:hypothetical protein
MEKINVILNICPGSNVSQYEQKSLPRSKSLFIQKNNIFFCLFYLILDKFAGSMRKSYNYLFLLFDCEFKELSAQHKMQNFLNYYEINTWSQLL